ncbi:RNA polymerase-binding transcription factor CarD [bioreactor metagenome]|uniref:RNA polymerase-binding transcription factor CarD n=1 Tax=bioreactor metagenome TaxID=1076179 RepID=A0A645AY11_9ZZZZ|nr:CarD family transcriptional regulator [Christensenella sp.]
MFQIGDMVCYPMHGVGQIESVQDQTVLGETTQYYLLRFVMGRMTAMVPVASAEAVGLRRLVCPADCEQVIAFLTEDGCSNESDNWNQRYRDNLNKLRVGDIFGVADVVKCLIHRDREKGLSAGERKMYLTARQVLLAELSASSGKEESEFLPLVGG